MRGRREPSHPLRFPANLEQFEEIKSIKKSERIGSQPTALTRAEHSPKGLLVLAHCVSSLPGRCCHHLISWKHLAQGLAECSSASAGQS